MKEAKKRKYCVRFMFVTITDGTPKSTKLPTRGKTREKTEERSRNAQGQESTNRHDRT